MAFKTRTGMPNMPAVGATIRVYAAGTTDLVTGLVTADSAAIPLSNPITVPNDHSWGFETPSSNRIDLYWVEEDIYLIKDINVHDNAVHDHASISGNAATATTLQTARTINGVSFNGSANVTINAVDSTARIASSEKGANNGVATLDGSGLVPATQLPSYVDDVLEYTNLAGFPATGETGKIYVAKDTNKTYRWSGSAYVYITSGAVDSVAGKTGVVTLVKGDVGLGNVDNTSDANKPVSSATQTALNLKANLASPALTGTPTAPTASAATNTTQVATTAFVKAQNYVSSSGVTSVTGTAPVVSSGGVTPAISMAAASSLANGYMTSTFANKLDNIEENANLYVHPTGLTGTNPHNTTKTDVGLGNVDNTSDAGKPVSTAQQTALNLKSDTSHLHTSVYAPLVDATIVRTSGTQSIGGDKTFTSYSKFTSDIEVDSGSVELDGGQVNLRRPVTTGGWARGFMNLNRDGTRLAGIGFLGSSDVFSYAYMGVGVSPWASTPSVRVSSANVTVVGDFVANGSNITALNATNLSTGTVDAARLPAAALIGDTTYSAMSIAEGEAGTATTSRAVRADYLKEIIEHHAASAGGGGISWMTTAVSLTAESDKGYMVDTTGGARTITLPAAPAVGANVVVADMAKNFKTNNCTIASNSLKVHGVVDDLLLDMDNQRVSLVYSGSTYGWLVVDLIN